MHVSKPVLIGLALGMVILMSLYLFTSKHAKTSEMSQYVDTTSFSVRKPMISIKSSAFQDGGSIPSQYTCDGQDQLPPLHWQDVPATTKSITIICDDPDAPGGTWVHWVVFNLPPDMNHIDSVADVTQTSAIVGTNSWGKQNYGGPCPPSGEHRYFFKIYALDTTLSLGKNATKQAVEDAMSGRILAEGRLMGRYARAHN